MINEEILTLLGGGQSAYYAKIDEWESWWRGYSRPFHQYWESLGTGGVVRRNLYRMNMAKKICEDWAKLLMNERVRIRAGGRPEQAFLDRVLDEQLPNEKEALLKYTLEELL